MYTKSTLFLSVVFTEYLIFGKIIVFLVFSMFSNQKLIQRSKISLIGTCSASFLISTKWLIG